MDVMPYLYWVPLGVSIVLCLLAFRVFARLRTSRLAKSSALLLLASAVWVAASGLELASSSIATKVFWTRIQYVGGAVLPAAWLVFALQYTGREQYLTRRALVLLSVAPIAMLLLVFTNEAHGLIWSEAVPEVRGQLLVLQKTYAIGYWAFVVYSYTILPVSFSLLVQSLAHRHAVHYWNITILMFAMLIPWLLSLAERIPGFPSYLDLTPLGFGLSVPMVVWGLEWVRRMDATGAARGAVIESVEDAIVVLDRQDRIIELNPVAEKVIGSGAADILNKPVREIWPNWPGEGDLSEQKGSSTELSIDRGSQPRTYEIRIFEVPGGRGRATGRVAILRDISQRKQAEQALQRMHEELEQLVADRTHELATLYDVTALATQSLDLQVTLERSLERALEALPCRAGAIHLLNGAGEPLRLAVQRGIPPDMVAELTALPVDSGPLKHVLQDGQPAIITEPGELGSTHLSTSNGFRMWIAAPMRARGQTVGVLMVFGEGGHQLSAEDLALLTSVADHVGIAVENAWLQQRAEQAAALEERERLARELHDLVTQSLFSLTLFAEVAKDMTVSGEQEGIAGLIDEMSAIAHQVLKETRLMIYRMRPAVLEEEGLVGALRRRLGAVEGRVGIKARVVTDTLIQPPAAVEAELYHIAQEALSNALRHSQASSVEVRLHTEEDHLVLEVADDGCGFDPEAVRNLGGMGLSNMRDRAESLGGTFTVLSGSGRGTTVRVEVSLASQPDPTTPIYQSK